MEQEDGRLRVRTMKPTVIGIVGKKKSGKDTVFNYIAKIGAVPVVRIAFGDELKQELANLSGLPVSAINDNKDKWRKVLQVWGTEFRRDICGANYWVDKVRSKIMEALAAGFSVVVTDCRFENERELIKSFGGQIIKVTRESGETDDHSSETDQDAFKADFNLTNDSTREDLENKVKEVYERIFNISLSQGKDDSGNSKSSEGSSSEGKPSGGEAPKRGNDKNKQAGTSK
jgi:hypothetical protein